MNDLKFETVFISDKKMWKLMVFCIHEEQRYAFWVNFSRIFFYIIFQCDVSTFSV